MTAVKSHLVVTKYNGAVHIEWDTRVLRSDRHQTICYSPPGTEVIHHTRRTRFHPDYHALNILPVGQWYNFSLGFHPDGSLRHVYCNVAMPFQQAATGLSYVDLDLDVLQRAGERVRLEDEDEFADHAMTMAYPQDVIVHARQAADYLLELGTSSVAPFGIATLDEALRFYGCELAQIRDGA